MTQYEMTEKLSEKMNVTMEEAKAALEASEWNMLDAALLLEQEHGAAKKADAEPTRGARKGHKGLRNLGDHVRRLIACGNRNRFEVRRGDASILELPVTVLAVLMLCAFWVCAPLLVIGLFAGCRYSFSGEELGREDINSALNKAADAAEHMKETVAEG